MVEQKKQSTASSEKFAAASLPGRLLGLDVGSKFIGCAVTDSARVVTTPLPTLLRKAGSLRLKAVERYVETYQPVKLIVGCPLQVRPAKIAREGNAERIAAVWLSPQARKIKAYAARLRKRLHPLAVELVDETLSTWESRRRYARLRLKKTADSISLDSFSAMEIIKTYLAQSPPLSKN